MTISAEEWTELRRQSTHRLPDALTAMPVEDVLLRYQRELLETTSFSPVVIVEKSRRIGATWGIAAEAVLTAASGRTAKGMDVFYLGYNMEMTREFIDTCAMWAREYLTAALEVEEFLFKDQGEREKDSKDILAFRIKFASGFEIVALTSRPRSLRGRQGWVIIDEAAFHDELEELLKAALALLMWGGRVMIISTHDGVENPFNKLIEEVKAGRKPYEHLKITFDDALKDGLYERICLVSGREWTPEGEAKWRDDIRAFYGDAAAEELDCIPTRSGGVWLPRALLENCAEPDVPVVSYRAADGFVDLPEPIRRAEINDWCEQTLLPLLAGVPPHLASFLGLDFARVKDKTVLWPLQIDTGLVRRTPFLVELTNVPFEQQWQIFKYVVDRLPRFSGGKLDATGNGAFLAERARQEYGVQLIEEVKLSVKWYEENTAPFKAAFEDQTISIPAHEDVITDLRGFRRIDGVPRMPKDYRQRGTDGTERHGDSGIAALLAYAASLQDAPEYDVMPVGRAARRTVDEMSDDDFSPGVGTKFKVSKGGW
ncbi:terminase large subunit domain-containing protein [Sneathiella sp.]|uniref:terminase large subunit domain-containing protein n=1 Tax=Sneathiella sp. TaxID=1964365 RepID=UPI002FE32A3C